MRSLVSLSALLILFAAGCAPAVRPGAVQNREAVQRHDVVVVAPPAVVEVEPLPPTELGAIAFFDTPPRPSLRIEEESRYAWPSGLVDVRLSNDAMLVLLPNRDEPGVVRMKAFAPGGLFAEPDSARAAARLALHLLRAADLGPHARGMIDAGLVERGASFSPYISNGEVGFVGTAPGDQVATLFELAHLHTSGVRRLPDGLRPPDGITDGLTGAYEVALRREAPATQADAALRYVRNAFGDLGRFTFVLVGDFDEVEIEGLAVRYLGPRSTFQNNRRAFPVADFAPAVSGIARANPAQETVRAGLQVVTSAAVTESDIAALQLAVKLAETEMGSFPAVRDLTAEIDIGPGTESRVVTVRFLFSVQGAQSAPALQEAAAVFRRLAFYGPDVESLRRAQNEAWRTQVPMANAAWLELLAEAYRSGAGPRLVSERGSRQARIPASAVRDAAARFMSPDRIARAVAPLDE
ncbi:hypothetical protein BH23BAC4_BH23BAC4_13750 [soil metagenome]